MAARFVTNSLETWWQIVLAPLQGDKRRRGDMGWRRRYKVTKGAVVTWWHGVTAPLQSDKRRRGDRGWRRRYKVTKGAGVTWGDGVATKWQKAPGWQIVMQLGGLFRHTHYRNWIQMNYCESTPQRNPSPSLSVLSQLIWRETKARTVTSGYTHARTHYLHAHSYTHDRVNTLTIIGTRVLHNAYSYTIHQNAHLTCGTYSGTYHRYHRFTKA